MKLLQLGIKKQNKINVEYFANCTISNAFEVIQNDQRPLDGTRGRI